MKSRHRPKSRSCQPNAIPSGKYDRSSNNSWISILPPHRKTTSDPKHRPRRNHNRDPTTPEQFAKLKVRPQDTAPLDNQHQQKRTPTMQPMSARLPRRSRTHSSSRHLADRKNSGLAGVEKCISQIKSLRLPEVKVMGTFHGSNPSVQTRWTSSLRLQRLPPPRRRGMLSLTRTRQSIAKSRTCIKVHPTEVLNKARTHLLKTVLLKFSPHPLANAASSPREPTTDQSPVLFYQHVTRISIRWQNECPTNNMN